MKYENVEKAIELNNIIKQEQNRIKDCTNAKDNMNHYSVVLGIIDSYSRNYIRLEDSQTIDFLERIIEDSNKKIEECKQEIEKL